MLCCDRDGLQRAPFLPLRVGELVAQNARSELVPSWKVALPTSVVRTLEDSENQTELVAELCAGDWDLRNQVEELSAWLREHQCSASGGNLRADVGFSSRRDALGGGPVVTVEMMKAMVSLDMELWLSEYPG